MGSAKIGLGGIKGHPQRGSDFAVAHSLDVMEKNHIPSLFWKTTDGPCQRDPYQRSEARRGVRL